MGDDEAPTDLEDTFATLADETRLAILDALWNADGPALGFAELRRAVGMRDSGNFNYHLGELVPQFVRETDAGYALTYAGARVVGAAIAGTYEAGDDVATDPVPVGDCPHCGGTSEIRHDGESIVARCADCERINDRVPAPPILASAFDEDEHATVFSRYALLQAQKRGRGICLLCEGPVEQRLVAPDDHDAPLPDDEVAVVHSCRACGLESVAGVASVLLDHPLVLGFCYEHGLDIRETPVLELPVPEAERTSDDPVRVRATLSVGDATLTLTLDESLSVVDHDRR